MLTLDGTDLEKVRALLTELGVGFSEVKSDSGLRLLCEQGMPKVGGYTWFYFAWDFDLNGKLIEVGAWE